MLRQKEDESGSEAGLDCRGRPFLGGHVGGGLDTAALKPRVAITANVTQTMAAIAASSE